MVQKGISRRSSRIFLVAAIIIFIAAEIIAEVADFWLAHNPSVSNLLTFNRWYSTIPQAMTTGAIVFLVFGLAYSSLKTHILVTIAGIIIAAIPFILEPYNLFSFQVQYYPGYNLTMLWQPLTNLFDIGLGMAIGAILGFFLRDKLTLKPDPAW